ncbi:neutral zinc metallopeptidase [Brevundimonas sp.]|uniref:KPN_02809 family neutral zinc metallopeptidase n=1 Tax=Brevundimonas sp. TaxID=1871086 RepID=UPI001D71C0A8|nr:neutral zinc metallopeptidase [Brevundimonas sp.]MBA3999814.1 flagellar biosynthesis protein FlgM [Brevundimonas sp.]
MRWRGGRRGGGIEDRRGMGPGVAGGGIGVAVLGIIGYLVFGIDPQVTTQVAGQLGGLGQAERGEVGTPEDEAGLFVDVIGTNVNDVWATQMPGYQPPGFVLYEQGTATAGCGYGQAAMGPFYCPADRTVYLDLGFWQVMSEQLGAGGDFAKAYVIAHEIGHHVQTLTGASDQVRQAQSRARSEGEANRYSVALELQADCYAGVWAANAAAVSGGEVALTAGSLEEGMNAASAIGDDRLGGGRRSPETFTHGTSAQRMQWLRRGYDSGDPAACDTFAAL